MTKLAQKAVNHDIANGKGARIIPGACLSCLLLDRIRPVFCCYITHMSIGGLA